MRRGSPGASPLGRIVVHYPDIGGMYGIKRYSVELARALENMGVDVRRSTSLAKELRIGGLRVGGSISRKIAPYMPVMGGLVHATTYHVNPVLTPADVVTVHDIMPSARPELYGYTPIERRHNEDAIERTLRRSKRVLTDTQHTKDEILRVFPHTDASKLTPIHLAIDHDVFRPDPLSPEDPLRKFFRPGMLNVLVVMNAELRKRVDLLLEAASRIPRVHVIHVGSDIAMPGQLSILAQTRATGEGLAKAGRYVHLGHTDDATLRRLMSSADVVVHPSVDEGFGLPPLEALACGPPVLASDIPPHREVLGDAVRYFELSADGIETALRDAWDGEALREGAFPSRAERLAHAAAFTWARTAQETVNVYEEVRNL